MKKTVLLASSALGLVLLFAQGAKANFFTDKFTKAKSSVAGATSSVKRGVSNGLETVQAKTAKDHAGLKDLEVNLLKLNQLDLDAERQIGLNESKGKELSQAIEDLQKERDKSNQDFEKRIQEAKKVHQSHVDRVDGLPTVIKGESKKIDYLLIKQIFEEQKFDDSQLPEIVKTAHAVVKGVTTKEMSDDKLTQEQINALQQLLVFTRWKIAEKQYEVSTIPGTGGLKVKTASGNKSLKHGFQKVSLLDKNGHGRNVEKLDDVLKLATLGNASAFWKMKEGLGVVVGRKKSDLLGGEKLLAVHFGLLGYQDMVNLIKAKAITKNIEELWNDILQQLKNNSQDPNVIGSVAFGVVKDNQVVGDAIGGKSTLTVYFKGSKKVGKGYYKASSAGKGEKSKVERLKVSEQDIFHGLTTRARELEKWLENIELNRRFVHNRTDDGAVIEK